MATKKLQMLGYKIVPPEHIGKSAYEIAVDKGFEGTEEEWLESLKPEVTLEELGGVAEEELAGKVETIIEDDYEIAGPIFATMDSIAWTTAEVIVEERMAGTLIDRRLVGHNSDDNRLIYEDGQDNYVQVTPEQVGAAPAGYGLGERNVPPTAWKYAKGSGFLRSSNGSPDDEKVWWGITSAKESGTGAQVAFTNVNDILTEAKRYYTTDSYNTARGDWEYVNPPMSPGVEYRTTDRFNGKVVYKRLTTNDVLEYRLDGEDEWHPYINQIGAAPAGYGLGTTATKITDWNDATKTGFYWNETQTEGKFCENAPFPWQAAWGYTIAAFNDDAITQVAFTYTGDYKDSPIDGHYQKVRYYKKGTVETPKGWSEWEYVNPQMMPGVEYRTTERWNGKPVYARMLNCGALPNATNNHIFIANNISNIVRLEGYLENTAGYTLQVPITATSAVELALYNHSELRLTTKSDQSTWNAYISVYYTKDS